VTLTDPESTLQDERGPSLLSAFKRHGLATFRTYHRHRVRGGLTAPERPTLFVANHGFGGAFDVNVLALVATLDSLGVDRPVTILAHQSIWTLGMGRLAEPLGARPAGRESALEAFGKGHHVVVFPGGDLDAFKPFQARNTVVLGGRSGFARLAMEAGVPIVPIVTAGAGETALVLSDGQPLANALRLPQLLRLKAIPVSIAAPWGLNVGIAGILPYLPAPARLSTFVLPAALPEPTESAAEFADRIGIAMQAALDDLVAPSVRALRPWLTPTSDS
jgi:1-acyl-sn-glycerol-3-phosphate acyltransferase